MYVKMAASQHIRLYAWLVTGSWSAKSKVGYIQNPLRTTVFSLIGTHYIRPVSLLTILSPTISQLINLLTNANKIYKKQLETKHTML